MSDEGMTGSGEPTEEVDPEGTPLPDEATGDQPVGEPTQTDNQADADEEGPEGEVEPNPDAPVPPDQQEQAPDGNG